MAIPSDVKSAIDDLRKSKPHLAKEDDEFLYHYAKTSDPSLSWGDAKSKSRTPNAKRSPNELNAFQDMFDLWIDEITTKQEKEGN